MGDGRSRTERSPSCARSPGLRRALFHTPGPLRLFTAAPSRISRAASHVSPWVYLPKIQQVHPHFPVLSEHRSPLPGHHRILTPSAWQNAVWSPIVIAGSRKPHDAFIPAGPNHRARRIDALFQATGLHRMSDKASACGRRSIRVSSHPFPPCFHLSKIDIAPAR